MVCIVAIGDQHFTTKNIPEIDVFINVVTEMVTKQKPDFIVLLGDLLHTHEKIHTVPLNKAYEFINNMRQIAKTFILVGNHDYINASQFLTTNHWLNSLKEWNNVIVVDKIVYEVLENKLFVFAPYVEPNRFIEALDTITAPLDWKKASIIFGHQEFAGCNMNGNYISNQGHWDLSFPQVIAGHIHTRQHLQRNVYYTGSSMETEWKEGIDTYNSIACLTYDEKNNLQIEEMPLKLGRKLKLHMDFQELKHFDVATAKETTDTDDVIKLQISGIPYEEFNTFKKTTKYKELVDSNIRIDFEFDKKEVKINNQEIQAIIDDTSLTDFRSIFESMANKECDPVFHQIYQFIMYDRVIEETDILIVK
jgi:DNA repair exonuclease SbcCD nuclease subunit